MADPREHSLSRFLTAAGWGDAQRRALAGDASRRRYERLTRGDGSIAVLMDAPREQGEDVTPFITIDRHLTRLGLSAPQILAEDRAHGFLLLEDLGDDLFVRVAEREPALEHDLYAAAVDLLCKLHQHPAPDATESYTPKLMTELAALAFDWYLPAATGHAPDQAKTAFCAAFEPLLATHAGAGDVLILRDYHAENLLWLPDRSGTARVGLLDFQDAMRGHASYDLISLLEDARRDVPPALREAMMARYIAQSGQDPARFEVAAALIAAQRNLRIVGVFARLCRRDGKSHYVDLLPRVWDHLMRDLSHPALADVGGIVRDALPAPDAETRERIKSRCASLQTR